jgi:hypothetical protein
MSIEEDMIRRVVSETLTSLGFDANNLKEMQADMGYLRLTRKRSEEISMKMIISLLGLLVTSVGYLVWDGLKNRIG